jgi:pyrimidine operon attenuation protein/uracil phosphoribosyltransferase
MADVLQKVITGNNFKNGTAVVSIDKLGIVANHTLDTTVNQTSQITVQSGVLDSRFDDVGYYFGGSGTP